MIIKFSKYQGTGNDFVLIDNRDKLIDKDDYKLIAKLCNRKFGIGADGLMLLENHKTYDFTMLYYNSDGMQASMCGNGGRCIVAFAHKLGVFDKETKFIAIDGYHEAKLKHEKNTCLVSLKMQDVDNIENNDNNFYLNTGSPHYVMILTNLKDFDTYKEGQKIRYNSRFKKEGTNVNFVKINENNIEVLTYERGVEDETLSCGTGVVASAICSYITNKKTNAIEIKTKGGILWVNFDFVNENKIDNIWLNGPATHVFDGEINI